MSAMNHSETYSSKVSQLREQLNRTKEAGVLPNDFKQDLTELEIEKDNLLAKLLPKYQNQEAQRKKVHLNIKTLTAYQEEIDGLDLQDIVALSKSQFIILHRNGQLQSVLCSENTAEIKIGRPLKLFGERFISLTKLDADTCLALSQSGFIFIISYKDTLTVKQVSEQVIPDFKQASILLSMSSTTFLISRHFPVLEELTIKIGSDKICYELKSLTKIPEIEWTTGIALINDTVLIGDDDGEVFLLQKNESEWHLSHQSTLFEASILKILPLSMNDPVQQDFLVLTHENEWGLLSMDYGNQLKLNKLPKTPGNFVDGCWQQETVLVQTDDGYLYVLEKIASKWCLNPYATEEEQFLIGMSPLFDYDYLSFDLEQGVFLLEVERLNQGEDLLKLKFFEECDSNE